jgi:ribonuclease HI
LRCAARIRAKLFLAAANHPSYAREAMSFDPRATIVFADGACSGNPGPGGWGAVVVTPEGQVTELGGAENPTTNNKMELTAVGKALRYLEKSPGPIHIYTDSVYVINGITKWIWGWMKRGWKTAEGGDVANVDYWKRLSGILAKRKEDLGPAGSEIEWKFVRGHAGIPGNERVDEIAVAYSKGQYIALYKGPLLKYNVAIHDIPENTDVPEMKKREAPKEAFSYLSLVGGTARRHKNWAECERHVKGVSGAKFKKCLSADEEKKILESWGARIAEP